MDASVADKNRNGMKRPDDKQTEMLITEKETELDEVQLITREVVISRETERRNPVGPCSLLIRAATPQTVCHRLSVDVGGIVLNTAQDQSIVQSEIWDIYLSYSSTTRRTHACVCFIVMNSFPQTWDRLHTRVNSQLSRKS